MRTGGEKPIEVFQPEPGHAADHHGRTDGPPGREAHDEILPGPRERRTGTRGNAGINLLKLLQQLPVTGKCEAGVVVLRMDLLHEGRFRVNERTGPRHTMGLRHAPMRISHVF